MYIIPLQSLLPGTPSTVSMKEMGRGGEGKGERKAEGAGERYRESEGEGGRAVTNAKCWQVRRVTGILGWTDLPNGRTTLENGLTVSYQVKHTLTT